jgi:hypothetical protein
VSYKGGFNKEVIDAAARGANASVLVACGPDGFARESAKVEGGVMTWLIVQALREHPPEAIDDNGRVSLETLRDFMWQILSLDNSFGKGDKPALYSTGGARFYLTLPRPGSLHSFVQENEKWRTLILENTDTIRQYFAVNHDIKHSKLRQLAAPIKKYAHRISTNSVVDELLAKQGNKV